ncbi:MAG: sulfurtransferase TusA family protein [Pseudomonadota bacterium]
MNDTPDLDALGLLCPLPVLKLRKRMAPLEPGAVMTMVADDPAAAIDVPHFCQEQGHDLVSVEDLGFPKQRYVVRKGG